MEEEEINIHFNANTIKSTRNGTHKEVEIEVNGEAKLLSGNQVLIATGRIPKSDTLNLENTVIKTNACGYIEVDNYCETAVNGV